MKNLIFILKTILLLAIISNTAWAQSANIMQVSAEPSYPPSITVKAAPAQEYTHVEYQFLINGRWVTVTVQPGQSVVNRIVYSDGAYKVRVRGKKMNPVVLGDWVEYSEGFRFTIRPGDVSPPPVGPLCVPKVETAKISINLGMTCSNYGSCGEAFGRTCYAAGGSVSGSRCYKNQVTNLTCT